MPVLQKRLKGESEVPDYYWHSENGNDTNDGSYATPWQSKRHVCNSGLAVGETAQYKDTVYPDLIYERIS